MAIDHGEPRQRCTATTASGEKCGRLAIKGFSTCSLKSHRAQEPEGEGDTTGNHARAKPKTMEEACACPPGELDFDDLIAICLAEMRSPSEKSHTMTAWARLILDAIKHRKEERRLLDGLGAMATYNFQILAPCDPPGNPDD